MPIRIPVKADIDTQNAFRDCEQRLRFLESLPKSGDIDAKIASLREELLDIVHKGSFVAVAGDTMTGALRVPKLEVDGPNFYLDSDGTYSFLYWDGSSDGILYNKSTNALRFFVGGNELLQMDANTLYSFKKHVFNNDGAFYFDKDATGPLLTVDSGDFYQYNRVGNTHGFYVGSSRKLGFDANYFLVGPTNPAGFIEAGVGNAAAVGSTTPAWNCYAKPIAGQWRANSSTALNYAGTAGNAIIWGGNQFDQSNGRINLVTIAGVASAGFQLPEAGVYRFSFVSNAEMVAGATYTIYTCRLNSASSGGLVEYLTLGSVKNWNAAGTHYHNICHTGTGYFNANEYIVVTHAGVGNMIDANWNTFSIERLN